ncbi:MAG: hypothetical protein Q9201_003478 [Fulgogasparrea decipioides]
MLEQQQLQLVNGLREFYNREILNGSWKGSPLQVSSTGYPLTHDILEALDALRLDGQLTPERFEEDTDVIQQKLLATGASPIKRPMSVDSDSGEENVQLRDAPSPKPVFSESLPPLSGQLPPTPPVNTPSTFFTNSPIAFSGPDTILPETAQVQPSESMWLQSNINYETPMGIFETSPSAAYNDTSQLLQQLNPCLPIPSWRDDDLGNVSFNNVDMVRKFGLQGLQQSRG